MLEKPHKNATKRQRQRIASRNIARELRAGKPRKQAIAAGLRSAGLTKPKRKKKK